MKKIVLALGMLLMLSCSTDDAETVTNHQSDYENPSTPSTPIQPNECKVSYRLLKITRRYAYNDTISDVTTIYDNLRYAPYRLDGFGYVTELNCGEKRTEEVISDYKYILIRKTIL